MCFMKKNYELNVFDPFDVFDDFFKPVSRFATDFAKAPRMDLMEKDGKYVAELELPGFDKAEIKISLEDGNLIVSAAHSDNKEEKDSKGRVIKSERTKNEMRRVIALGDTADVDQAEADYTNGLLTIKIPKKELPKPETKMIEIK